MSPNPIMNTINAAMGSHVQPQNQNLPTNMDDPRMADAKNYVQTHGGNPKAAFYQLCKEKMMNPATIINMVMGNH